MLGEIYYYIYLFVLGIVLFHAGNKYLTIDVGSFSQPRSNFSGAIWLLVFCILFIGLRPVHEAFSDMVGYDISYTQLLNRNWRFSLDSQNILFDNFFSLSASVGIPSTIWFTMMAAIYFISMFLACRKLFPSDYYFAYIVCLTAFSTFSYATNGIKAGAAASIFLLALAYKDKFWLTILLSLISWGFHHSMSVILVAYFLSSCIKNTKLYFLGWTVAMVLAILNVTCFQGIFARFTDESGARYLLATEFDSEAYLTGFRIDFLLYSVVPIIVAFWMIFKKKVYSEEYNIWVRMYLMTNAVWLLCMNASFSNRIAYLSWFMYPIVLIYPYLAVSWSNYQLKYARKAAIFQYMFSVFMAVYVALR